jgi:exodeoxyribonuclease-3
MKILSQNINGIRSNIISDGSLKYKDIFLELPDSNLKKCIDKHNPDIICFQETRCGIEKSQQFQFKEYPFKYWNESKGDAARSNNRYSGTCIWSKIKPISVQYNFNNFDDQEGRFIFAEFDSFNLINIYVPNSGTNFDFRTHIWDKNLKEFIDSFTCKPLIVTGDFNVVNDVNDIWNIKTLMKANSPGVFKQERDMFHSFLENYIDIYRFKYPDKKEYTWWNMRTKSREKNQGWRIDYFLIQKIYSNLIKDCIIDNSIHGSDHCPIILEL